MKLQRKIKRHIARVLAAGMLATTMMITPVFALPNISDANVVVGKEQITITQPDGNTLKIAVGANGVIDWTQFSIDTGKTVDFNFADKLAILNRVTGGTESVINGTLQSSGANGSIFLVNPNGVLIGSGANINAGNLVLSTLNVSNDNFMQLVGSWKTDDEHPLLFTKDSQQTVAGKVEIQSGAKFQPMGYLGLIGGSITIAPGITIETSMDSTFVAADKATINFMQHSNGAIEHYDTASFESQAANRVAISGKITSDSINIQGHTITLDKADLTTNWLSAFAGKKFEQTNDYDNDRSITTLTATPDNKITLTDSSITLTDPYSDEEYFVMLLGGQVDMGNSSISIDDQITRDMPKVIIAAANAMQWQFGGRDLDDDDYAFVSIHINDANPNNTIALNNVSITNPNSKDTSGIFVLGGKVDITGSSVLKGGEVFIGAGTKLGVENAYDEEFSQYWDEYYFSDNFKSVVGNTVTLGNGTLLVGNGESAIYGNAITNAGTIQSHGHYGLNISAFDEAVYDYKTDTGYISFSKNNQVINTGTISADQANFAPENEREYGIIGIDASIIDNTGGTIQASRHPDAAKDPNHWPGEDGTTGAADLLAFGTVKDVDPADKSIKVVEKKLDLANYNYKLHINEAGDILSEEKLPINGGPIDPTTPTNPSIDEILNGSDSLEQKQEQIIEVVSTINTLPTSEQAGAVAGAISSIQGQASLSQSEKAALVSSVVNSYEGTAAAKTEANNQITTSTTTSNTGNPNTATTPAAPSFASSGDNNNVVIE